MPKLIVNPRTDQSWEIPLPAGITVLGSDPACEFPITHETVSPAHCEIHVADGVVRIKDLGSAHGTFVDHAPVTEAPVAPGQGIQLGGVELALATDVPHTNAPPLPPRLPVTIPDAAAAQGANAVCKYHARALATWHCGKCQAYFCDLCVNVRRMGESVRHLCRKCGTDCAPVAVHYEAPVAENFYQLLPAVFSYPLRGSGAVLLVGGVAVFAGLAIISSVSRFVPFYGALVGLGISAFVTGYVFNYWKSIVLSSAQGKDEPPDWPDFSDWVEEVMRPWGQLLALLALTFGPFFVVLSLRIHYRYTRSAPEWFEDYKGLLAIASLAVGALFAPMGMLLLAMFDSIVALNPVVIVRSIFRIPLAYLVAAGTFELVLFVYVLVDHLVHTMGAVSLVTDLVMRFIGLYACCVGMRILGLLYRTHREQLGWV